MSENIIKVREMQEADLPAWDRFVEQCSQATFFHKAGWKQVIESAFGHKTHFLLAETGSRITGVLPLGKISSVLFGSALISTPFCVCGGIASENEESRTALERAAVALAEKLSVDYLELRNQQPLNSNWPSKDLYVNFSKELADTVEGNMLAIPRKQRAMVRKAIKQNLTSNVGTGIDEFYKVYSESVRNLGTPVLSKRYFRILSEVFAESSEILHVRKPDGTIVAAVMSFIFRDQILPYYGGGTSNARGVSANDFMYWELMKRSCEQGIRLFDYGRSKQGTGSYSFKKNWGFEPKPLHYEYHLVRAKAVPNVSPTNPKYKLMVNAWRRLPLSMANVVGPMISSKLA